MYCIYRLSAQCFHRYSCHGRKIAVYKNAYELARKKLIHTKTCGHIFQNMRKSSVFILLPPLLGNILKGANKTYDFPILVKRCLAGYNIAHLSLAYTMPELSVCGNTLQNLFLIIAEFINFNIPAQILISFPKNRLHRRKSIVIKKSSVCANETPVCILPEYCGLRRAQYLFEKQIRTLPCTALSAVHVLLSRHVHTGHIHETNPFLRFTRLSCKTQMQTSIVCSADTQTNRIHCIRVKFHI